MNSKDIVVIVPLHEINDDVKSLLPQAIASVPEDIEIRISCANGLSEQVKDLVGTRKKVAVYEDENPESEKTFQKLVNQAVGDSKWFSILEFDDEYTPIWFDNVKKYITRHPDLSVCMFFEDLLDFNGPEKNKFVGIGNVAPWASSFSEEIGFLDLESLKTYFDFYLTGSVFNTDDWISCGGLKESMKVTFWYEFLMRVANLGKKIFVIPKVGYSHNLGRKNSLIDTYKNTISEKEGDWWFELARREYFFKEDRKKEYKPEEDRED